MKYFWVLSITWLTHASVSISLVLYPIAVKTFKRMLQLWISHMCPYVTQEGLIRVKCMIRIQEFIAVLYITSYSDMQKHYKNQHFSVGSMSITQ